MRKLAGARFKLYGVFPQAALELDARRNHGPRIGGAEIIRIDAGKAACVLEYGARVFSRAS